MKCHELMVRWKQEAWPFEREEKMQNRRIREKECTLYKRVELAGNRKDPLGNHREKSQDGPGSTALSFHLLQGRACVLSSRSLLSLLCVCA